MDQSDETGERIADVMSSGVWERMDSNAQVAGFTFTRIPYMSSIENKEKTHSKWTWVLVDGWVYDGHLQRLFSICSVK